MGAIRRFTFGKMKGRPEVIAFLTASGITDTTTVQAITYLVDNLITSGLWNKYYAIFPFVGTNAFQHSWDLKRPNNGDRLTFFENAGITYTNSGFSGGYAQTNVNPILNQSLYNQNIVVAKGLNNQMVSLGVLGFNGNASTIVGNFLGVIVNSYIPYSDVNNEGVVSANKLITSETIYKNGVLVSTIPPNNLIPDSVIAINAIYQASNNVYLYQGTQRYQFVGIGQGLTDTEVLTEFNIISEFNNILGRKTW